MGHHTRSRGLVVRTRPLETLVSDSNAKNLQKKKKRKISFLAFAAASTGTITYQDNAGAIQTRQKQPVYSLMAPSVLLLLPIVVQ